MPSQDDDFSPAGELTTEFVLSPAGGNFSLSQRSASAEEDGLFSPSVAPTPYREEAAVDDSERLLFEDTEESLQSPLLDGHPSYASLRSSRAPARLNGINILNMVTYVANMFVAWGIGIWGLNGLVDTRWEIITKYETLVTPAHWAYYLWAPILVTEGLFAAAQLLPHYRARPIVQDGTAYFFFYTFIIQTAWTVFFSFRVFVGSFVSVVAGLLSLLGLLASQHKSLLSIRQKSRFQYFLFRFPFYLHTGWMVLMTVDHLCLLLRRYAPEHASMQIGTDILALATLLIAAAMALTFSNPVWWPEQDFVIPLVVIWAYVGIAWQLNDPSEAMVLAYGLEVIAAIQWATIFFTVCIGVILVPCVVVWAARECCVIRVVELENF